MHLAYNDYGSGFPLIILHGLLGSSSNWHTLSSTVFSEHFHVFAVDQRNHGRSPHSDTFDYPSMVEDLVVFMDEHDLDRAHLLGHSMGGKTAMHFALAHPGRLDHLLVVDIAPKAYPPRHRYILDALEDLDPSAYEARQAIDAALAERVPDLVLRQFLLKNLAYDSESKTYAWQVNLSAIADQYDQINAAIENGRAFDGPTRFIRGGESDYIADDDLAHIRSLFPQADLVTIDGADHWVHSEKPEPFAEAVLTFLR